MVPIWFREPKCDDWLCLSINDAEEGAALTISELAVRVLTQQSTVSLLVGRLNRAGLVRRKKGVADARQVCVTITPKGLRVARHAAAPPMTRVVEAIVRLTPEQLRALDFGLEALLVRRRSRQRRRTVASTGTPAAAGSLVCATSVFTPCCVTTCGRSGANATNGCIRAAWANNYDASHPTASPSLNVPAI